VVRELFTAIEKRVLRSAKHPAGNMVRRRPEWGEALPIPVRQSRGYRRRAVKALLKKSIKEIRKGVRIFYFSADDCEDIFECIEGKEYDPNACYFDHSICPVTILAEDQCASRSGFS